MKTSIPGAVLLFLLSLFHSTCKGESGLIFQTPGALASSATRPSFPFFFGQAGEIRVDANPVTINRIGFYGRILKPANVSWVVYANVEGSLPLMRTPSVAMSPGASVGWLESPVFAPLTLAPGTTYYLGFIAEVESNSVQFNYNDYLQGVGHTQGGLTSPVFPERSASIVGTFASPTLNLGATVQLGLRVRNETALQAPKSGIVGNSIRVAYYLSEAATPGSMKVIFNDGTIQRELTLGSSMETAGSHEFFLNPANPLENPVIVAGTSIPDGTYSVSIQARRSTGETMEDTSTGVQIDTIAPDLALASQPVTYTENDPPRAIAPGATVSDATWGGGSLQVQVVGNASAADRITVTNTTGLLVGTNVVIDGTAQFGTFNLPSGTTPGGSRLVVTLNGNATNERVAKLIRALHFLNASEGPSELPRSVEISVYDGSGLSASATQTIAVVGVIDRPVLQGSGGVLNYTEQSDPLRLDSALLPSDLDNSTLASASVSISSGFSSAEDLLMFNPDLTTIGNITGTYDPNTGVLQLTSDKATATLNQWRTALQSVYYYNPSETPSTVDRLVDFVINDGTATSDPLRKTVKVTAVNDRPVAIHQTIVMMEDTAQVVLLTGADPESSSLTFLPITAVNHGTLSGKAPNLVYTPPANYAGFDAFNFIVNDGALDSAVGTIVFDVRPVNDAPTLRPLPNLELVENWGATVVVPFNGVSTGAPNELQSLAITATSSNPALIADPSVQFTDPDTSGTLAFKPLPGANGLATISVTVNDGGGGTETITRTFTVTVTGVNSPPSFVKGADIFIGKNSGAQSIPAWATAIQTGPADEAGQTIMFITDTDRPELFAEQPRIAANGTLTFRAAPRITGAANVSVYLRDNGGIASGGVDQSAVETFQIVITSNAEELGTYTGLVLPDPATDRAHERGGLIRVQVAGGGVFTGTLRVGGATRILQGRFGEDGRAVFGRNNLLTLPGSSSSLALTLQLDVAGGTGKLSGAITAAGQPFAAIDADRVLYSAAASPAPPFLRVPRELLGRYTAVLDVDEPSRSPSTFPQGSGYGALTLGTNGFLRWTGKLADGTPVGYGNFLSPSNSWPVHMLAYEGRGSLTGRLWLEDHAIPRITGVVDWFAPTNLRQRRYPLGWPEGIRANALGLKFSTPLPPKAPTVWAGLGPISTIGNAELHLSTLDLPSRAIRLNIHPGNRIAVLPPSTRELRLQLSPAGVFTGTQIDHVTKRSSPIGGVVLQGENRAAGFYLTPEHAGAATIIPATN